MPNTVQAILYQLVAEVISNIVFILFIIHFGIFDN